MTSRFDPDLLPSEDSANLHLDFVDQQLIIVALRHVKRFMREFPAEILSNPSLPNGMLLEHKNAEERIEAILARLR